MVEDELVGNESLDEDEESGSNFDHLLDRANRKVYIEPTEFSIFETHRRYIRGDIELRPFYQRNSVWTEKKKSRLIESILHKVPIQAIYLAERADGTREVIDGQQRLTAIFEFRENKFTLKDLTILTHLNNKKFEDFETDYKELQRNFEDYMLSFFLVKKESDKDIRFDIFERINVGATPLNAQELRNSMYRGAGVEFLKRMAEDESFKKMTDKLTKKRSKEEEAVLRFLAFYINGHQSYSGNMNVFLNNTLEKLSETERDFQNYEYTFKQAMKTCIYGSS